MARTPMDPRLDPQDYPYLLIHAGGAYTQHRTLAAASSTAGLRLSVYKFSRATGTYKLHREGEARRKSRSARRR